MVFESGERVWKEEKCGLREAKKKEKTLFNASQ